MLKSVPLGPSGLRVSELCLGTMNFGQPGRGHQGDWTLSIDEARPIFEAAIEAGGGAQAHLDLGKFFFTQQAWDSALKHLTISLSSSQNGGAAVVRMIAASQHHLKQHAMAAENFKRAYQLEKDPRTLLSAAIAHHAGGQHTESIGVLKLMLGQEKQMPEIHFQLALAFTALKQTQAAKASLQRYLRLAQGMKSQAQTVKQAIALLGGTKKTANGPQGAPSTPAPPKK